MGYIIKGLFTKGMQLQGWQKILIGLVGGILCGILLGPKAAYLKPVGTVFINAIKMMVTPVVFTAIVCAVISMDDVKRMRRLGAKTISFYAVSMAIASAFGIGIALFIGPGKNFHPDLGTHAAVIEHVPSLLDTLVNIVPSNPVNAFAQGNVMQVLVFALLLGIAINLTGEPAKPVADFFRSFSKIVFKLTGFVMSFAPVGIFALMAWVAGEFGLAVLLPLLKLVVTVYLACFLFILCFYCPLLFYVGKLNVFQFFKRSANPILFAFTSASSAATLPFTMKAAEENLGIPSSLSRFLLPLGMSLNMNGMAVFLGIATVFSANMYDVHLGLSQCLTMVLTIVLTGMGAGGVPGTGVIALSAVLTSMGLPLGAIPLMASVDRINDMMETAVNVTADLFTTTMIAKHENELDLAMYNQGIETGLMDANEINELSGVVELSEVNE